MEGKDREWFTWWNFQKLRKKGIIKWEEILVGIIQDDISEIKDTINEHKLKCLEHWGQKS